MHTWGLRTSESIKSVFWNRQKSHSIRPWLQFKDYRLVICSGASREPCSSDVAKEAAETHAEQSLGQTQGSYSISQGPFRLDVDPMQLLSTALSILYFVFLKLILLQNIYFIELC